MHFRCSILGIAEESGEWTIPSQEGQDKAGLPFRRAAFAFILGVDSPFFSKTGCFTWVFDGFLNRRIPGKNGNGRYP